MTLEVDVQYACAPVSQPTIDQIRAWATAARIGRRAAAVVVRIVDEAEGAELNARYRYRDYATNVLSFPFDAPPQVKSTLLGDLVLCAPVIAREANEQGKTALAHWAHMVIHAMLHLQGYNHESEREARAMEALEIEIMVRLGYRNPYE
jgi:probable rRNA maturation factor